MRKISSVTDDQPLYSLWWCFYSQSQSAMFFEVAGHIRDLENKFLHRGWWLAPPSFWSRWLHESSVFVCWSLYQWLLPPPNQWHGCVVPRDLWLLICAPPQQSLFWWPMWIETPPEGVQRLVISNWWNLPHGWNVLRE